MKAFLTENSITWNVIPPRSLSFGRLWEAAVKSQSATNTALAYEEFTTFLAQIKSCLYSRLVITRFQ